MISAVLQGARILVCRPEPAASELVQVLESVGAVTYTFSTIAIKPIALTAENQQKIYDLDQYKKVLVVSQHAAKLGLQQIEMRWPQFPVQQKWFGIGRKSTDILLDAGLDVHPASHEWTSETLLNLTPLRNVQGERILVLKGEGGRSVLEQGLRDRGALIDTLSLYTRALPAYSKDSVSEVCDVFNANCMIALSAETLDNFKSLVSTNASVLSNVLLIVSSERVAEHANSIGFCNPVVSEGLKPIDIVRCIAKNKKIGKAKQ